MVYGYRVIHKGRVNKKGKPVKDLEVDPTEATIVQELFELAAYEGKIAYAMAEMLNNQGLRTHSGVKFTPIHVLRILRHEGYLGYIVIRSVRSQQLPELEIISPELFQKANEMVDMRCTANAEARKGPTSRITIPCWPGSSTARTAELRCPDSCITTEGRHGKRIPEAQVQLLSEENGYRTRTRFARFFNLPELMSMFKEVADIKASDQLHLPVPESKFETVVVKPSEIQKEMVR